MNIALTQEQVFTIIEALEWQVDSNYPKDDPINATYLTIVNRIKKQLPELVEKA